MSAVYPVPKAMTSKSVVVSLGKSPPVKKAEKAPIFLQKTYHMIDTCDSKICKWAEDGLSFVVKDPTLFETTVRREQ